MKTNRFSAVAIFWATIGMATAEQLHNVEFQPIHVKNGLPGAPAPGVLRRACTLGQQDLQAFFHDRGVNFDQALVTSHKVLYCHIYFEPSRPGVRASVDTALPTGSKLPVPNADVRILKDPHDASRLLLLFGDSTRKLLGRAVREEEFQYLLREEFGVDQSVHIHTGAPPLAEHLTGPSGSAVVTSKDKRVVHELTHLGFRSQAASH